MAQGGDNNMRKHAHLHAIASLAVALGAVAAPLVAQGEAPGFPLDQYRAAETPEDGFAISRPDALGHLRLAAQLHLDYAYNPLVWETIQGDAGTERGAVVRHMLAGTLGLSLGLRDGMVLAFGLPVNLVMSGEEGLRVHSSVDADGTTLGDPYLAARFRLLGERDSFFALAVQPTLTLPAATWTHDATWAGERSVSGAAELLAELRPRPLRVAFNVGARFRKGADVGSFTSGHDLTWGLGLWWQAAERIEVGAEAYGSVTLAHLGVRENTPAEAIGGARFRFPGGLILGLAGGAGVLRGVGSPDLRTVLTLGWAQPGRGPEPVVECPDPDGDRICGDADGCPNEPEDEDGFEDADGCPDPDNDQDGIPDTADGCPNEPEDKDGFEDADGCPDPDNDQDGIPDAADRCPDEPEDKDEFEDEDGCPDRDNDQDKIIDPDDACPTAPGPAETKGCPLTIRVDRSQIVILQQIQFDRDRDTLRSVSVPILKEVLSVLKANPQIRKVLIEGHTDSRNTEAYNMDLSQRRAATVVRWLSDRGVDGSRLEARGLGEGRPIDTNATPQGRLNNRRVEFHILDPPPPPAGGGDTPAPQGPQQ